MQNAEALSCFFGKMGKDHGKEEGGKGSRKPVRESICCGSVSFISGGEYQHALLIKNPRLSSQASLAERGMDLACVCSAVSTSHQP